MADLSSGSATPDPSSDQPKDAQALFQVRRLARQSTLLISSGAFTYAGALLLNVILARTLGPGPFGAWVVAFAAASTLAPMGMLGSDWMVVRHGSHFEGLHDYARLRRTLHLAIILGGTGLLVLGVSLFALAPTIARKAFHDSSVAPLLQLAAVLVPVLGFGQIMINGTRAFKSVREIVLVTNILQPLLRLLGVTIALFVTSTEWSAFLGLVIAEVCLGATAAFALHRRLPFLGPTAPIPTREIIRFVLPAWGTRLLENARSQMFPVILGSMVNFSASGAYVASKRVAGAPNSIVNALLRVYSPIAGDLYMQGRRQDLTLLFKNLGKWSFTLGFPLCCLLVAFPREILSLFGASFRDESPTLVVLAIAMLFVFGTGPVTVTLVLAGRPNLAFIDYVIVFATEIGLGIWLIPQIGILGAAVAKLVGTAINNGLPLLQVWRLEGLQPYRLDYWKPLAAGGGAVLAAKAVLSAFSLRPGVPAAALAAIITAFSYLALLLIFRPSDEERAAISTLARRVRP